MNIGSELCLQLNLKSMAQYLHDNRVKAHLHAQRLLFKYISQQSQRKYIKFGYIKCISILNYYISSPAAYYVPLVCTQCMLSCCPMDVNPLEREETQTLLIVSKATHTPFQNTAQQWTLNDDHIMIGTMFLGHNRPLHQAKKQGYTM